MVLELHPLRGQKQQKEREVDPFPRRSPGSLLVTLKPKYTNVEARCFTILFTSFWRRWLSSPSPFLGASWHGSCAPCGSGRRRTSVKPETDGWSLACAANSLLELSSDLKNRRRIASRQWFCSTVAAVRHSRQLTLGKGSFKPKRTRR